MRVTAAFSRLLCLPGVWVQEGSLRAWRGGGRGRAQASSASVPVVRVLDGGAEGHAAGRLGLAASRPRHLAARGSLPPSTAVVPGARRADRGCPVRSARLGVHARLRVPRRVAGNAHRQDHDQADAPDRLGHGRADRQARLRRRARSRPSGRPLRHRDRRGQLEAPAQLPHPRGRPSSRQDRVGQPTARARRPPIASSKSSTPRSPHSRRSPQIREASSASRPSASAPESFGRSRWTWATGTPPPLASTRPRR